MECKLDIGSYKVSWFDQSAKHVLQSQMFPPDKRDDAMALANSKKSSLVMKLISQDTADTYAWQLDDAKTWQMDAGRFVFENKIVLVVLVLLIIAGTIFIVQKITGAHKSKSNQ